MQFGGYNQATSHKPQATSHKPRPNYALIDAEILNTETNAFMFALSMGAIFFVGRRHAEWSRNFWQV